MSLDLPVEAKVKHFYRYSYVETCNGAFAKMYGYERWEDMVGKSQFQLHGGEEVPENIEIMKQFINSDYRLMQALSKEVDKEGNGI